jgi:glycosyltransferase involved in cell wall biosynthesis
MSISTIYYVTADYPPDRNAGSMRASATVAALQKRAKVVVLSNRKARAVNEESVRNLIFDNPQGLTNYAVRFMRELLFMLTAYVRLLFVPDKSIIILASPPFFSCLIVTLLRKRKNVRLVLDVRDLYPDVFVHANLINRNTMIYKLLKVIEARAYARSDLILTISKTFQKLIRTRSDQKNVQVAMNGYSKSFRAVGHEGETGFNEEKPLKIVTHGNFGQFQDVDLINQLIAATRHLPISFTFVGFGEKLSMVTRNKNVVVGGTMDPAEIAGLLGGHHLGLSFRTSDFIGRNAVPLKILEYMGTGLPALVVPKMPDLSVLEKSGAIRAFEADQLDAIVSFIQKVITDRSLYKIMRKNVLSVRHEYSREQQIERALHYIISLTKDPGNTNA